MQSRRFDFGFHYQKRETRARKPKLRPHFSTAEGSSAAKSKLLSGRDGRPNRITRTLSVYWQICISPVKVWCKISGPPPSGIVEVRTKDRGQPNIHLAECTNLATVCRKIIKKL